MSLLATEQRVQKLYPDLTMLLPREHHLPIELVLWQGGRVGKARLSALYPGVTPCEHHYFYDGTAVISWDPQEDSYRFNLVITK